MDLRLDVICPLCKEHHQFKIKKDIAGRAFAMSYRGTLVSQRCANACGYAMMRNTF